MEASSAKPREALFRRQDKALPVPGLTGSCQSTLETPIGCTSGAIDALRGSDGPRLGRAGLRSGALRSPPVLASKGIGPRRLPPRSTRPAAPCSVEHEAERDHDPN